MDRNTFPTRSPTAPPLPLPEPLYGLVRRAAVRAITALCAVLVHCGPPSWPGGVHAVFGWSSAGVRIAEVPQDGPAAEAGLREGDRLLAIDGVAVSGLSTREVREKLSGEVGSEVVLRVERAGETLDVRVKRAPYKPKS